MLFSFQQNNFISDFYFLALRSGRNILMMKISRLTVYSWALTNYASIILGIIGAKH